MLSLHAELAAVPDFRRAQGRKHAVACVLAMHVLAELANMKGCLAAAQFARSLSQAELEAVGAWTNPKLWRMWSPAGPGPGSPLPGRSPPTASASAALVDHASGAPFALLNFGEEEGELAATHDLLERSDIRGKVITLDALHTTRKTAKLITERADYVFAVKGNSPETFGILDSIDWERDAAGRFEEDVEKAHGRLEQRSIRVIRYREPLKKDAGAEDGKDHIETAYLITSLDAKAASPEDLLRLNRGHWTVENLNHRQRDCVFGEDASA